MLSRDFIYFISEEQYLLDRMSHSGKHAKPVTGVLIVGGGPTGLQPAVRLEEQFIYFKIIEIRPELRAIPAECLNKTVNLRSI